MPKRREHEQGQREVRVLVTSVKGNAWMACGVARCGRVPYAIGKGCLVLDQAGLSEDDLDKHIVGSVLQCDVRQCADGWWFFELTGCTEDGMPVFAMSTELAVSELNVFLLSETDEETGEQATVSAGSGDQADRGHRSRVSDPGNGLLKEFSAEREINDRRRTPQRV